MNAWFYMNKKWCAWKRHYWCLFFIEWIEMPVMPDISAHWLAGWRTRIQQLLEHGQSVWDKLFPCCPFVLPDRIWILFPPWIVYDLGAACMLSTLRTLIFTVVVFFSSINNDLQKFESLSWTRTLRFKLENSLFSERKPHALYVICVCACTQVPSVSWADPFDCAWFPLLSKPSCGAP